MTWLLLAPFAGQHDATSSLLTHRAGPVSWAPRYDAQFLDGASFNPFLRYVELNPVRAGLTHRAIEWPWSSAKVHGAGVDPDPSLSGDRWPPVFRRQETVAVDRHRSLDQQIEAERANRNGFAALPPFACRIPSPPSRSAGSFLLPKSNSEVWVD